MSWVTDQKEIDIFLEQRAYRQNVPVPHRDMIVGIDKDSLGLKSGAIYCKTRLKVVCADCGQEKELDFSMLYRGVGLRHRGCVTRERNYHRVYDEGFRVKISNIKRGMKHTAEARAKMSLAGKGRPSHRRGKKLSPEFCKAIGEGSKRAWVRAKQAGSRERRWPYRRVEV